MQANSRLFTEFFVVNAKIIKTPEVKWNKLVITLFK
jgi:hypothetical protein